MIRKQRRHAKIIGSGAAGVESVPSSLDFEIDRTTAQRSTAKEHAKALLRQLHLWCLPATVAMCPGSFNNARSQYVPEAARQAAAHPLTLRHWSGASSPALNMSTNLQRQFLNSPT